MPFDARSYAGTDKPYVNRSHAPRMTRAHFEVVAAGLAAAKPLNGTVPLDAWGVAVRKVADFLADTNPRFERAAFYRAAGLE